MKQSFNLLKDLLKSKDNKVFFLEFFYKDLGYGAILSYGFEPEQITVDEFVGGGQIINFIDDTFMVSFSDDVYSWSISEYFLIFISKSEPNTYWKIEFM